MTTLLRFWGTRGSVPAPGPRTVRYGGNTPCIEVRTADGRILILDAGTGIRELGRALEAEAAGASIDAEIFLSHSHWDHIQGLPFFAPLFTRGNRFTIWGFGASEHPIERAVRDQMASDVFPVRFDELAASVEFRHLSRGTRDGTGYRLTAFPVQHPGGAVGVRFTFDESGGALVYVPDNELGLGAGDDAVGAARDALVAFAAGASVLVHDATYTPAEYVRHHGWGHSAYDDVVRLALDAEVKRLILFHHHPERSDDDMDRHVEECRALARSRNGSLHIVAAAEGMTVNV